MWLGLVVLIGLASMSGTVVAIEQPTRAVQPVQSATPSSSVASASARGKAADSSSTQEGWRWWGSISASRMLSWWSMSSTVSGTPVGPYTIERRVEFDVEPTVVDGIAMSASLSNLAGGLQRFGTELDDRGRRQREWLGHVIGWWPDSSVGLRVLVEHSTLEGTASWTTNAGVTQQHQLTTEWLRKAIQLVSRGEETAGLYGGIAWERIQVPYAIGFGYDSYVYYAEVVPDGRMLAGTAHLGFDSRLGLETRPRTFAGLVGGFELGVGIITYRLPSHTVQRARQAIGRKYKDEGWGSFYSVDASLGFAAQRMIGTFAGRVAIGARFRFVWGGTNPVARETERERAHIMLLGYEWSHTFGGVFVEAGLSF